MSKRGIHPPARVPSPTGFPGPNPRPSISSSVRSGRSGGAGGRKTIEDFESALRNPNEVIYLSSSPVIQDGPHAVSPQTLDDDGGDGYDEMSFDEEMRRDRSKGHENGHSAHTHGHGHLGTPGRGPATTIVPPTPSSVASTRSGRRGSIISTDSGGKSASQSTRIASMKMNQSLGLDAELSAADAANAPSKRRSIFRSPGTASSPDLATLVRRAKEKNVKASVPPNITPIPAVPKAHSRPSTSSRPQTAQPVASPPSGRLVKSESVPKDIVAPVPPVPSPVKVPVVKQVPQAPQPAPPQQPLSQLPSPTRAPPPPPQPVLPPAPPQALPPAQSQAPSPSVQAAPIQPPPPPTQLPPIQAPQPAQAPPIPPQSPSRPTTSRAAQASTPSLISHGYPESNASPKTMSPRREKAVARGIDAEWDMAEKDSKNKSTKSKGMFGRLFGTTKETSPPKSSPQKSRPPIPPMPPLPAGHSKLAPAANISDVFGRVDSSTSYQPTIPRSASVATSFSVDKPIEERRSSHIRQPADSASIEEHKREREPSFSEDVAGILDRIGNVEPAKELGLPADSLRVEEKRPSVGEVVGLSSAIPPIPENSVLAVDTDSPKMDASPKVGQSPASRPSPTMRSPHSDVDGLMPASVPLSRTSSSASAHRTERTITPVDDTRSVRLVSSPRPTSVYSNRTLNLTSEGLARSHFASTVAWGKQSPRASLGTEDASPVQETEDDEEKGRQLACEFLENDSTHVPSDKVAEFLGGPRRINAIALKYYMQYFDMRSQKLDQAFRDLCAKLHLKAESQEIDRIIEAFSARFFECNPTTVYGTPGVVHTVTGAMLMLNTDLHIADLSKHMSRADFVRNAMRAIQESMPDRASTPDLIRDDGSSSRLDSTIARKVSRTDTQRSASGPVAIDDLKSGTSSTTSFSYTRTWELEAENVLKEIYANVRSDRILLPIGPTPPASEHASTTSLSRPSTMRSPSGRSDRLNPLKRTSIRGNSPYGAMFSQSDGRLSPTPSFANSIGEQYQAMAPSLGFASNLSQAVIRETEDETHSQSSQVSASTLEDMNDDELALLGAPWAKEGLLDRKLQPTEPGRSKLQKKDWKQYFVVIGKGELHMFVFGEGSSSMGGSVGGGNWLNNARATGEFSLMHATAMSLPRSGYSSSRPYCFTVTLPNGDINIFAAGTEDLVVEWVAACNYWAARTSRQPLQGGVSNMEYGWTRALEHRDEDDRASVRSARSSLSRLGGTYGRRALAASPADKMHINEWKPPPHATMPSPLDEETQLETLQAYVRSLKEELAQHKLVEEPMQRLVSERGRSPSWYDGEGLEMVSSDVARETWYAIARTEPEQAQPVGSTLRGPQEAYVGGWNRSEARRRRPGLAVTPNKAYTPGSKNAAKARDNWLAKSKYIHSEIFKYETYVESLRSAIGLRVKKQGEKKLERSLARSMGSLQVDEEDEDERIYVADEVEVDPTIVDDGRSTPGPPAPQGVF